LKIGIAKGEIYTIVLFGNTQEILDEVEQSIYDVLHVLSKIIKEPRICYGGGLFKIKFYLEKKN